MFIKAIIIFSVLIVITLVILLVNRYTSLSRPRSYKPYKNNNRIEIPAQPDWQKVDAEVIHAVQKARKEAEQYAEKALSGWADSLMLRVNKQFIPWYFGYVTQTRFQMLYVWYAAIGKITGGKSSPGEKIFIKIQDEFSSQVLRPEISELEIKNIAQSTVNVFINSLHEDLRSIKETYSISETDWNNHINNIASLTSKVETQRSIPLLLKAVVAAGLFTSIELTAPAIVLISTKLAPNAAASITGSAGKFASFAGKSLGSYVAIAFILWEIIDHYHTRRVNAPILRQSINDYLTQLNLQIKQKIMSTITEIENDMVTTIKSRSGKSQ